MLHPSRTGAHELASKLFYDVKKYDLDYIVCEASVGTFPNQLLSLSKKYVQLFCFIVPLMIQPFNAYQRATPTSLEGYDYISRAD